LGDGIYGKYKACPKLGDGIYGKYKACPKLGDGIYGKYKASPKLEDAFKEEYSVLGLQNARIKKLPETIMFWTNVVFLSSKPSNSL